MSNNAIMTLRASFNEQIFSYLELLLPKYNEQVKVGDLLYLFNEKIKLNNKINTELEAMAKLIYDYWFVQFDFPDKNGKPYKTSGGKMVYNKELKREIPVEWEVLDFGDLVEQVNDNIEPNEYPLLPYLPIDKLPKKKLYYSEYESRNEANSSLLRFKEDDILLGAMRVYFHRVCNAIEDGISRSTMMVLRPKEVFHKNYALFTLNREEAIKYATKNSTGSSIPYAKWNKGLEKFKVCVTNDNNLFEDFNKTVNPILNNFKALSKQNQKLAELRDWLLPMLMNGQVRVGEVEEQLKMVAEDNAKYGEV
jgi:type I restriction enzyme S subunit